ncbi:hypothetical protein L195_g059096 [Trifolium pratense]|uniref:Uncharacterized protein n=1 Tax=Trifolium pratense TaxID=57577 RepID=A0A2K3JW24_TRIPR|nr:hypothetical protein L195_g059096 [Trifolium pratense]
MYFQDIISKDSSRDSLGRKLDIFQFRLAGEKMTPPCSWLKTEGCTLWGETFESAFMHACFG